jgi:hypothetical protein
MLFGTIDDIIEAKNTLKFHVNPFSSCGATNMQSLLLKPKPWANY